ncbi:MAG: aldo/keto reductase, partial [Rhodospirillaceae bacterium]|nr:aldo/keto reductase [Rhodospirillaceae bacterium]
SAGEVAAALEESLTRLRRASVYAVLVHDAGNLLAPGADRLWRVLERFRAGGKARRIGVSVYNPEQARAVAAAFPIEIIQLPFNIYDQRFLASGVLAELKGRGVEVHARSAFLQGLLLMPPAGLPPHFAAIRARHAALHALFAGNGAGALAAALHFCLAQPSIDRVVVGCETAAQFGEIRDAAASPLPDVLYSDFAVDDVNILEPSRWPK